MLPQFWEKIKSALEALFWPSVAFLVVVLTVGVWRLTLAQRVKIKPQIIENAFPIDLSGTTAGDYVASKNGEVYYPTACKSAGRIKPENRLFFATALEAEGAGFRRSTQCGN
jgi:hypothetical protein